MGFFDRLLGSNINKGVEEWRVVDGAVLLDVRNASEYKRGHIPGSVNITLGNIDRVAKIYPQKDVPLFVHCLSGSRSAQAVSHLRQMGYTNVKNIGGISGYKGEVVR